MIDFSFSNIKPIQY